MANRKLTIFQGLTNLLNGRDPKNPKQFKVTRDNLTKVGSGEYDITRLEKKQEVFLSNQWKKIDNELYQKAIFYEPTRIASYYDYESMEFCLAGDTKIATPEGFTTIKELADKGRDNEFIVYSYDHNEKRVVPAIARNAHYTRDEMTYKITFDDGNYIIATYEHRLMRRDGSFARVKNLKVGDSMMPFYRKSFYNNQNYNWVYTCNSNIGHNGWVPEHNLVAEWAYQPLNENEEVHHIDFNGKNNLPENLKIMDRTEHRAYHAKLNNEKLWSNPEYRKKMLEVAKRKGEFSWGGRRSGKDNPAYFSIPWDNITNAAEKHKTLKGTARALNISHTKLQREITYAGYRDWSTFLEAYGIEKSKYSTARATGEKLKINHKIVSIEEHGVIPVYDLTVPNYKNFATDTIFSHNTPEISAALDIFMEEATTPNEEGKILEIYSEQDRIRAELEDLFYNRLDINTNLPSWVRNTVKYGDNFVYNKLIPNEGFVGVTQLPNIEITRTEPSFNRLTNVGDTANDESDVQTKFHWKNRNIEFNSFEISHFRLVGDDRRLPYGTSILEKARRIWKQLLLSEDAMLVYRITRAPERRVHKVFVGNMDDKDVDAYVDKVANEFRRNQIVDNDNGQVDTRYNHLAVDQDIFVPVRTENAQTPIDTLQGASNLGEIADIEYIQQKLFAALRIPKAFLGFEDAFGDGKNLAILDIRFARAVHRIQKSIIQELNRMAIMHLYMRGLHDDLDNFQLSLVSPSTQADLLKLERWREKIGLYQDAVSDAGNGFGAMSMTKAQKDILGFTEDEIRLDIQRQAVEKAAAEEAKLLGEVIKQSGVFKDLYDIYGINPNDLQMGATGEERDSDSQAGGFTGGGDLGGDTEEGGLDLGLGGDESGDTGGEELGGGEELMENVSRLMGVGKKKVIQVKPKHKSVLFNLNENVRNTADKVLKAQGIKEVIRENLDKRKNYVDKRMSELMGEIGNLLDENGNIKLNQ